MQKEKILTIVVSTAIVAGSSLPVNAQSKIAHINEKQQFSQKGVQQNTESLEQDVLTAKQESDSKKQVMNVAKQNKEKADAILKEKAADLSKAKLLQKQAKSKANATIQTELDKQFSILEDVKQSVVDVEKEKEHLATRLKQKNTDYSKALTDILVAQKDLQAAKEAAKDITPEILEEAKEKKLAAENQVTLEKGKLDVASKAVETAKKLTESVEKEVNTESMKLQKAQEERTDATSSLQTANEKLKHAEAVLASLQGEESNDAFLIAQENLKKAQQVLADAKIHADNAKAQELAASKEVNEKKAAFDVTKEKLTILQEKLRVCNAKVMEAEKNVEHAKMVWADVKRLLEEATLDLNTAKGIANQKGIEVQDAQKSVQTAENHKVLADKKVTAAQVSVTEKQVFADKADAIYKEGSLGFFEYMKDAEAVNVLKNAPLKDYTEIGNEEDATSLKNMRSALTYIKECNDLRKMHHVQPLNVSSVMMAIAQSNLNWSSTTINHSSQFEVAENLSWGYPNPFRGWYDEEKAIYDKNPNAPFNQVGHYLNIINPQYKNTGFAVSQKGDQYSINHGQVFISNNAGESIDSYVAKFEAYCSSLTNAKAELEAAKKALLLAKQEQDISGTKVSEVKQKLQTAEIAKRDADEVVKQKESVLSEKQNAVDVAVDIIKEKEKLLAVAEQEKASLQNGISELEKTLYTLQDDIDKASADYNLKQAAYKEALKVIDETQAMVKQREDELAAFDITIVEAMQNVQNAKETVEKAEVLLLQCQTLYNEAQTAFNDKQEYYIKLKQALELKEKALQECNVQYQLALDNWKVTSESLSHMHSLCKAVDDANVNLQLLEHTLAVLETDIANLEEKISAKEIALSQLRTKEAIVHSYIGEVRMFQQAFMNIEEADIKNLPTGKPIFEEFRDLLTVYKVKVAEVKELESKYKEAAKVAEEQNAVFVTAKTQYEAAIQQLTQAETKWNDFIKDQLAKDPVQNEDKKAENKPVKDKEMIATPKTGDTTTSFVILGVAMMSSSICMMAKKRKKTKQ